MQINSSEIGSVTCRGSYFSKRADQVIKQIGSETGLIIEYHVLRALEEQGFEFNLQKDNKSVYQPNLLVTALAKYGKEPKLVINERFWKDAWSLTMRTFGASKHLEVLSKESDFLEAIKEEKASGAPLFMKKGDAFHLDFERMMRFTRGECAAQPCVAYHRIQHGHEGPKTRLVWGYPLHMTLLEAKFARPLIQYFLTTRSVIAFGLHRHELASRLIPIENMGIRYGFDFSGYDSTLHPRLISKAFDVLKTYFKSEDLEGWDRMVHYFIHTPILMWDKKVYVKHQGVPSGSYFTQLIDSIINYFAQQYACLVLLGKPVENSRILVLGDDGLLGLDGYIPLAKWATTFAHLGLRLNSLKSNITRSGEGLEFLGHTWSKGLVNRSLEDIAKRMAFPERNVRIEDPRLRILSRILAYGSDALNAHLIIQKWSRYKGPDIYSIYYRDVLTEPMIGWREFVTGDRPTFSFPKSALDQSYIGILT